MGTTVLELTTELTRCAACHRDARTRPFLLTGSSANDPALRVAPRAWYPPRGWGGSLAEGPRGVLLLATNPGHPFRDEAAVWRDFPATPEAAGEVTPEQATAQFDFVSGSYLRGGSPFHTRSVKLGRAVLWLVDRSERRPAAATDWRHRIWFSDVVKCSTAIESSSPGIEALARRCAGHLERELGLLQPRVVVSLGGRAREVLGLAGLEVPILEQAPHPSGWRWRKLDDPEWDPFFRELCRKLGLDWDGLAEDLGAVRRALQASPRGPLPGAAAGPVVRRRAGARPAEAGEGEAGA